MKKIIMKKILILSSVLLIAGCEESSDKIPERQQEQILLRGASEIGMPKISNFREKKLLKEIIEKRDQEGLITYTYIFSEQTGKFTFICDSVGYGIPYATQFTSPLKYSPTGGLPQADPNGLFSPASADGTWVMCKDPNSDKIEPRYIENKISVFTFRWD